MNIITRAGLAAAAGALGLAAACGSSGSTSGQPSAAPITAAPTSTAPILREAGIPAADIRRGGTGFYGDGSASGNVFGPGCTGSCSEQVGVYTNASQSALNANMAALFKAPGGQAVITGDRFVLAVTGVEGTGSNGADQIEYFTSPATFAQRVHGHLIIQGNQ
jgi:hypothetical protein